MATAKKRPRRANLSLSTDRGVKAQKIIYWTEAKLQKLLLRLVKKDRGDWFAARIRALKSWPVRTTEENIHASREPRRLMDGRWHGRKASWMFSETWFDLRLRTGSTSTLCAAS